MKTCYTAEDLRKLLQASDLLNASRAEIIRTLSMLLGVLDGSEVIKKFGKFSHVTSLELVRKQDEPFGSLVFETHKSGLSISLVSHDMMRQFAGQGFNNLSDTVVTSIPREYVLLVRRTLPDVLTVLAKLFPSVDEFAIQMIGIAERESEKEPAHIR